MRKIIVSILLVLTVALALPMASCNGNGGKNDYRISDPVGADATAETSADADSKAEVTVGTPVADRVVRPEITDYEDVKYDCTCAMSKVRIEPDKETVPPGTLPDVEKIPDADVSDVGKTLSDILTPSCPHINISAAYYYGVDTGKERLVVIEEHGGQVALLSVYETDFGGASGFYRAVETGNCSAKLIGRCYITFQEAMYSAVYYTADLGQPADAGNVKGNVLLAGVIAKDGARSFKVFNVSDDPQSMSAIKVEAFEKIYARYNGRFGLESLVSVLPDKEYPICEICSRVLPKIEAQENAYPEPPGTLPEVGRIPCADTSDVGKTLSDILTPSCPYINISAAYYYGADTGKERLVVIEEHGGQVALLSVYETDFGGASGFYRAVETGNCSAKLIGRCYITFQEAMYSAVYYTADLGQPADAGNVKGNVLLAGVIAKDGARSFKVFNVSDDPQSMSAIKVEAFEKIYARYNGRFGLGSLVAVN